ncbi:CD1871A family CXXC motif-containing protein [Clostridium sp. Marseille-P2415]|nr:CD1871A family CXXC motif-containing protein [Clostridium sp. Marseille-P2415]
MSNSIKLKLQAFTCIIAAVFLVYGISRGEMAIVLNKAVNICLECIGLG